MPKFKIKWQEEIVQYWEVEVEADNKEDAENIYYNGEHLTGDEVLDESSFIQSDFIEVEEIKE